MLTTIAHTILKTSRSPRPAFSPACVPVKATALNAAVESIGVSDAVEATRANRGLMATVSVRGMCTTMKHNGST